jgi:hypothetical protein
MYILSASPVYLHSQCGNELVEKAYRKAGPDANYVREFKVKYGPGTIDQPLPSGRFPVSLNYGVHYRFSVSNAREYEGIVVLELFFRDQLLESTYNFELKRPGDSFDHLCKKTGTYDVIMSFMDGKAGCAAGVLSSINHNQRSDGPVSTHIIKTIDQPMYAGIPNKIKIPVPEMNDAQYNIRISQGIISKNVNELIVEPENPGRIKVYIDKRGQNTPVKELCFDVLALPVPVASLGGKAGGRITKDEIEQISNLKLIIPEDLTFNPYTVISFQVGTSPSRNLSLNRSDGNKLSSEQISLLSNMEEESSFYIKNIIIEGPQGMLFHVNPLHFIIK